MSRCNRLTESFGTIIFSKIFLTNLFEIIFIDNRKNERTVEQGINKLLCFSDIYAFCIAIPKCYGADLYNETKKCLEKHVELLSQVTNDSISLYVWFQNFIFLNLCRKLQNLEKKHFWRRIIKAGPRITKVPNISTNCSGTVRQLNNEIRLNKTNYIL